MSQTAVIDEAQTTQYDEALISSLEEVIRRFVPKHPYLRSELCVLGDMQKDPGTQIQLFKIWGQHKLIKWTPRKNAFLEAASRCLVVEKAENGDRLANRVRLLPAVQTEERPTAGERARQAA